MSGNMLEAAAAAYEAQLASIWTAIGLEAEDQGERMAQVAKHVQTLLGNLVQQEERQKQELESTIGSLHATLLSLQQELGEQAQAPECSGISLMDQEELLEDSIETLRKEKETRLESLIELESKMEVLQASLVLPQDQDCTQDGDVSLRRIERLKSMVSEFEKELSVRKEKAHASMTTVRALWEELGLGPATDLEQSIADSPDTLVLSPDNLESLNALKASLEDERTRRLSGLETELDEIKRLWEALETQPLGQRIVGVDLNNLALGNYPAIHAVLLELRTERKANIQKVIRAARKTLAGLWNKCHIDRGQQLQFRPVHSNDLTEALLEEHEAEIRRLQGYYAENEPLFKMVERREAIFQQLDEFDRTANDVDRLTNRGGRLLREEKFRKAVAKELPKLEKDIKAAVLAWESEHGAEFNVDGERYIQVIVERKDRAKAQKEQAKAEKKRQRMEQARAEVDYGSVPVTPSKRFNGGARTPKRRAGASRAGGKTPSRATKRRALGNLDSNSPAMSPAFKSSDEIAQSEEVMDDTISYSQFQADVPSDLRSSVLMH